MKKGFTLIELIASIGLMAMLSTIIIIVSTKKINETKLKSKEIMLDSIQVAAIQYVNDNLIELDNFRENDYDYISLDLLVKDNKLSTNLIDQTTNKALSLNDIVYVTRSYDGNLEAQYNINQIQENVITLNGPYNIYLDKNEQYEELGATILNSLGERIIVPPSGVVDVTQEGIYTIYYIYGDKSIKRNIIVGNNPIYNNKKVRVIVDLDGGKIVRSVAGSYYPGESIDLGSPTKNDFVFINWTKNSGNTSVLSGNTLTVGTETVTIKAVWIDKTYNITYNCNGGKGSTLKSTHNYHETSKLSKNGCYKDFTTGSAGNSYYLKGWATTPSSTTIAFTDEQIIDNYEYGNMNLYAVYDNLFSYTGNYYVINESNGNWLIKFLNSGILTLNSNIKLDIFLLGGGYNGGDGWATYCGGYEYYCAGGGGTGGTGGTNITYYNKAIPSGTLNVSIGSAGIPSTFDSTESGGITFSSNDTGFSYGGAGGGGGSFEGVGTGCLCSYDGSVGSAGIVAFDGNTYAGGGGGGGGSADCTWPWGGGYNTMGYGGAGGAGGGGTGGAGANKGYDATPNTGGGGGAAGARKAGIEYIGKGATGIILIRNARE